MKSSQIIEEPIICSERATLALHLVLQLLLLPLQSRQIRIDPINKKMKNTKLRLKFESLQNAGF